jgi:hypothetical protein
MLHPENISERAIVLDHLMYLVFPILNPEAL